MSKWTKKSDLHHDPRNLLNRVTRIITYRTDDIDMKSFLDLFQYRDGTFLVALYYPSPELLSQCRAIPPIRYGGYWVALFDAAGKDNLQNFIEIIDKTYHLEEVKQEVLTILGIGNT